MKIIVISLLLLLAIPSLSAPNTKIQIPGLSLANVYHGEIGLENYWVSEKFDGVRAFWNGKQLVTRQGNVLHAPEWFINKLPEVSLDGELWAGRGRFEYVSGIVRRQTAMDESWRGIVYMVFDAPDNNEVFNTRLKQLKKIIHKINKPHIRLIKQYKVTTHENLMNQLDQVVSKGGEGLMLHLGTSLYKSGRNNDLLKVKKYNDTEAVVTAYIPGKGKYTGMMGALEVEMENKIRFKIGSGFTDEERKNPPPIGSFVTFKYYGLTRNGVPRFASFLRIRKTH